MLNRNQIGLLRAVTIVFAGLFGASLGLLLWASTRPAAIVPGSLTWEGVTDVLLAVVLAGLSVVLAARANRLVGRGALRAAFGAATWLLPLMLVGMWLAQGRLLWNVLLVGLAWRLWVALYALPAAIAVWRPRRRRRSSP